MVKSNFFISTAIDYPSAKPHCGHLYEKILADVLARWKRLDGFKVHFSTGLDEHGLKIQRLAEKEKKTPKEFVDKMSKPFLELCKIYNISYDDFIRTTQKRHEKVVKNILTKLYKNKFIYKAYYEGQYCVECETFYTTKDLVEGKCPVHKKQTEFFKEEGYFFKMSYFQNKLISYIKKKHFIVSDKKRNEILNRLNEPLKDLSITRKNVWGLQFPIDSKYNVAVWTEALINYLTTIDYPKKKFKTFWPGHHLIGPDIVWHHTIIWGSMLMACKLKLPLVLTHGYINLEGEKMSKSLGNIIDPLELSKKYQTDSIRYFLLREIQFGKDGDFSENKLTEKHNNELVNDLGNLVSRTLTLAVKSKGNIRGKQELKINVNKIDNLMQEFKINEAIAGVWAFIKSVNKYVNDKKPWELEGKKLDNVLYNLLESLRIISILVSPFIPETAEKISKALNIKLGKLKDCKFRKINYKVKQIPHLFEKIDVPKPINKEKNIGIITMDKIKFSDWQKMDLRVGKIKAVKDHPNAEKLYLLLIDIGPIEQNIQLVAGLKQHYKKEELLNKKVIVFRNLESAVIRGEESAGMVLAAVKDNKVVLITPDKDIDIGARIQ